MPSLPPKTLRALRHCVELLATDCGPENERYYAGLIAACDRALAPKRSVKAAHKRKAEKDSSARQEWIDLRIKVLERADGRCEKCGATGALEVDHMFGRGGGRKSLQSIYTCWALCFACHRAKTRSEPSAADWLKAFIAWAAYQSPGYGYGHACDIARKRLDFIEARSQLGKQVS